MFLDELLTPGHLESFGERLQGIVLGENHCYVPHSLHVKKRVNKNIFSSSQDTGNYVVLFIHLFKSTAVRNAKQTPLDSTCHGSMMYRQLYLQTSWAQVTTLKKVLRPILRSVFHVTSSTSRFRTSSHYRYSCLQRFCYFEDLEATTDMAQNILKYFVFFSFPVLPWL